MLEISIQTSYDQNAQLILKSYLPVVYGTPLSCLDFVLQRLFSLSNLSTLSVRNGGYTRITWCTLRYLRFYLHYFYGDEDFGLQFQIDRDVDFPEITVK